MNNTYLNMNGSLCSLETTKPMHSAECVHVVRLMDITCNVRRMYNVIDANLRPIPKAKINTQKQNLKFNNLIFANHLHERECTSLRTPFQVPFQLIGRNSRYRSSSLLRALVQLCSLFNLFYVNLLCVSVSTIQLTWAVCTVCICVNENADRLKCVMLNGVSVDKCSNNSRTI